MCQEEAAKQETEEVKAEVPRLHNRYAGDVLYRFHQPFSLLDLAELIGALCLRALFGFRHAHSHVQGLVMVGPP